MISTRPETLEWIGDAATGVLRLVDQRRLPVETTFLDCADVPTLVDAIRTLAVRGAPAIGCAAAYGCVLGARSGDLAAAIESLAASRPTAVNLFWALDRMKALATDDPQAMLIEARAIHREDAAMCEAIGAHGAPLIHAGMGVLTHCNAGALATGGIGTATAPMYTAHAAGVSFGVYADETRPLLQGARLTAWELQQAGLDVTVLCDNAAASLMAAGRIDLVITGADRIAANGDAANKIGTYGLAILAKHHGIPFYVAAPTSTFDRQCAEGCAIPIEQRDRAEVARPLDAAQAVPDGVVCANPAFDVTPAALIAGLITERGIVMQPDKQRVAELLS